MTLFRLKQLAAHPAHAIASAVKWNYDRAELIADGVVHVLGVLTGLIAATGAMVTGRPIVRLIERGWGGRVDAAAPVQRSGLPNLPRRCIFDASAPPRSLRSHHRRFLTNGSIAKRRSARNAHIF